MLSILTLLIFANNSSVFISSGANSNKILILYIKIGTVVARTSTAKTKVVIGSAIFHSGRKYIIIAATSTPTAWIPSPSKCIIAALMLIFSFYSLGY